MNAGRQEVINNTKGHAVHKDSVQLLLIHPVVYGISLTDDAETLEVGTVGTMHLATPVSAPHHFLVFYQRVYCSGSLIASKIVLTVASCFHVRVDVTEISVKFGCKESLEAGKLLKVVEKKEHEYFRYKSELDNDIALLVLERDVVFNANVQKILLFDPDSGVPEEVNTVSVTGWGGKGTGTKTQEKFIFRVSMSVISQAECFLSYPDIFTSSMFCAKFDSSNRLFDNGGAAVYSDHVVGISSYGAQIHHKPYVALFTNVTYFYKWIKLNSERLLAKYCFSEREPDYMLVDRNYYAGIDP